MKKRILSILILLCLLCLVSCQSTPTDTTTTTTPAPDVPPPDTLSEDVIEPRTLYCSAINFHTYPSSFSVSPTENIIRSYAFQDLEYAIYMTESDMEDIQWSWCGMTHSGKYTDTRSSSNGMSRRDFTRYYKVDGYGSIGYDVETGVWCVVDFRQADEIDKAPTTEKLTQEECRAIALEYINNYVTTVAPHINLEEYTLREMDLQGQKNPFYNFVYEKRVDGMVVYYDTLFCGISEYGSLIVFLAGDDCSSLYEQINEIDLEAINAQLIRAAEDVIEQNPDMNFTYKIVKGCFEKMNDGSFVYKSGINFYYTYNGSEQAGKLSFVMLI